MSSDAREAPSGTERVEAAVQSVQVALGDALIDVHAAAHEAESLRDEAAAHGWNGVARTIDQADDEVRSAAAALEHVQPELRAAMDGLRAIVHRTAIQDVAEVLATTLARLETVIAALGHADEDIDSARESGEAAGGPRRFAEALELVDRSLALARVTVDEATAITEAERQAADRRGGESLTARLSAPAAGRLASRPKDLRDFEAQDRWAHGEYARLRDTTHDVAAIAASLAASPDTRRFGFQEIVDVKEHLMRREHDIRDPDTGLLERRRFDPDPEIAAAWSRLSAGTHRSADLVLLDHEIEEIHYGRDHPSAGHLEAHRHANSLFNWQRLIEEGE